MTVSEAPQEHRSPVDPWSSNLSHNRPSDSDLPPTVLLSETVDQSKCTDAADASVLDFELGSSEFAEQQKVGRYRLQHTIGSGGMGVVVLAYDELLERNVAVKIVRRKFLNQPNIHRRFVNEALLTSQLQHPCIIPIYDLGHAEDQRPFFAMKLIYGQSLACMLANAAGNHHDRSQLLKIFEQVCQTLAYSHSQQILHLDIKPSNIMIGQFGEVHVTDWGLARICSSLSSSVSSDKPDDAESHGVGGTPSYMSPEQARGENVSARSDVFGLGALLCEILTGKPPYEGPDQKRVHARAMGGKIEKAYLCLDKCNRDHRLVDLAKKCLAPLPNDRPKSAAEVASEISIYLESALEQAESDICRFFDLTLVLVSHFSESIRPALPVV